MPHFLCLQQRHPFFSPVGVAFRNSDLETNLRKLKAASTAVDTYTASDGIHSQRIGTVPRVKRVVVLVSLRRPGFDPRPLRVGFMVDEVAVAHVYLVFACPYDCANGPYSIFCHRCRVILATDRGVTHSKPGGYYVYRQV